MGPHVLIVSRYDGAERPVVHGPYPSWDDAYEGQAAWVKLAQTERRSTLGWHLHIVPLQEPV